VCICIAPNSGSLDEAFFFYPAIFGAVFGSGVNQVTSYIRPYRIDVRQGNWVDQEMVSQLKPGQTRDQVRFILGSPLVSDMFHADRWDYIYRFQPGRGEAEQRRLTVYFQDDKLVRVGGDVVADDGRRVESKPVKKMNEIRYAIAGSAGRMGRTLIEAVLNDGNATLSAALEHAANPFLGKDAGESLGMPCGVKISADIPSALAGADCLIDFTRPEGTLQHLAACRQHGISMIIGTTGFSPAEKEIIAAAAREIPIVFAPNMAVGVNAVFKLLDVAARILDSGYDIEVIESHHRHKVDAPSGTALRMGEVVAAALGRDLSEYRWRPYGAVCGPR